ncbi:MAG: hypothetical protein WBD02_01285 [Acidimicrobiia bacterium]
MDIVELALTGAQAELLDETLRRVNLACDTAAKDAFARGVRGGAPADVLREACSIAAQQFQLASPYPTVIFERVRDQMKVSPSAPPRFRKNQAIPLAGSHLKWTAADKVSMPTWKGRRTITIHYDQRKGAVPLRSPLEHRPIVLVERTGVFYLEATDVDRREDW